MKNDDPAFHTFYPSDDDKTEAKKKVYHPFSECQASWLTADLTSTQMVWDEQ